MRAIQKAIKPAAIGPASKAAELLANVKVVQIYDELTPDKQALLRTYLEALTRNTVGARILKDGVHRSDWEAVAERVAIACKALDLPASEATAALRYKGKRAEPLLTFAKRHHQDLNWLVLGDAGSMCHQLAFNAGWRPVWWTPDIEATEQRARQLADPTVVSPALRSGLAAHTAARAAVEKFCARTTDRENDEKRLAKLCDAEARATWALLDLQPASPREVAMILKHIADFVAANHVLPQRAARGGETGDQTFEVDLIRAAAGWLRSVQS